MREELAALGVTEEAVDGVLAAVAINEVADLEQLLGADNQVIAALLGLLENSRSQYITKLLKRPNFGPAIVRRACRNCSACFSWLRPTASGSGLCLTRPSSEGWLTTQVQPSTQCCFAALFTLKF